jgi:hypothetical protein
MPVFLSQIQSLDEQTEGEQWLPSSGPMTENEFRLLFSESVCESDFPLVDDDGEFTTEAIDRLTNIAECTAERLFAERDAAVKRAEAAEAREATLRGLAQRLWGKVNTRRCDLIKWKAAGDASERDLAELAELQAMADEYIRVMAPLPIKELEAYMRAHGIEIPDVRQEGGAE